MADPLMLLYAHDWRLREGLKLGQDNQAIEEADEF